MKGLWALLVIAVALGLRFGVVRRVRKRRRNPASAAAGGSPASGAPPARRSPPRGLGPVQALLGDAGLVAGREVKERVRGRAFRVGTVVIIVVVSAAIVIPVVNKGSATKLTVGVVGAEEATQRQLLVDVGHRVKVEVRVVEERDVAAADAGVRSGRLTVALADDRILVQQAPSATDTSDTATYLRTLSVELGIQRAYAEAGLSTAQAEKLARAQPVPVVGLHPSTKKGVVQGTSIIGVILIFVMLSQYLTWTLIGVMEEKASRVVEVLLATMRPIQLLAGKVLGIGVVAMGQAALVLAFAIVLAKSVGSDLLHGAGPLALLAALLWLVLGYAFYCWVYATAGSMIERQDQVQSLALPLSLPMLVGYISSLTAASSNNPTLFIKVLAYLPPTAPFAMPVLVGMSAVTWWEFVASALISVITTVVVARAAARVYQRAILRTGKRVTVRELVSGAARA